MAWLEDWSKRIKLTIDSSKIDSTLVDFPVAVTLSSGTGVTNTDVTDVFESLTVSGVLLNITCDGTFSDYWIDNSNGDSYAEYSVGRLSLDLNNGGANEAVNVVTQNSFPCFGFYTFEFDWYPVAGAYWYDDDFSDAQNDIKIVTVNPTYNTASWKYSRCEEEVGLNSYLGLFLRSSKSNLLTIRQRINGTNSTLVNTSFTYGAFHKVKWEVDFDNYIMNLYIDEDSIVNNVSWNSTFIDFIGDSFKYNFHWHSYAKTANQKYDNLFLSDIVDNRKKIAVTTDDGVTQCPVEIERWGADTKVANLWTKVPVIYPYEATVLYLYYDNSKDANTSYVGDTTEAAAQSVWDDNFQLVVHMAQAPNGDVANAIKDSTSNANYGTPGGSMASADLVDGKVGKAIDFDGSNDYISITDNESLDITDAITVSVLVNLPAVGEQSATYPTCIAKDTLGGRSWSIWITKYLQIRLYLGGVARTVTPTIDMGGLGWKQITVTYDGAHLSYYIDDALDVTDDFTGTIDVTNTHISISRGYLSESSSARFQKGLVDEVRISSFARSGAWIKATYYSNWDELVSFGAEELYTFELELENVYGCSYNLCVRSPYIYKATVSGIKVYGLETASLLDFIDHNYASSVWANDSYMYMATSVSGIYRCEVSTVTGTVNLEPYKQYQDITSNYVYCIHGGGDYLCATTESGVDHYDFTTGSGIYTTLSGVGKCFQTERGEFYYAYNSLESDSELHVVYDNTSNWDNETVGYIYNIGNSINDIYVTEKTSRYGDGNVLFIATSSGVTVVEEKPGDEENSNFKYYLINT